MPRFFLLINVFLLMVADVNSQSSELENQSIDSILNWMKNNVTKDSNDFHALGLRTLKKAYAEKDYRLIADLHGEIAVWHNFHGHYSIDSTLHHDKQALKYYIVLNDSTKIPKLHGYVALDHINQGNFKEAQTDLFKAVEIYEAQEDALGIAKCHRTLSILYVDLKEAAEAVKYGNQALATFTKEKNYYLMALVKLTLTEAYEQLENYEMAQQSAKDCINIVETEIPDEVGILIRAYAFKAEVSLSEGLLDQALAEATKAWKITSDEVGSEKAKSYRSGIGNVLVAQKKYKEALPHLLAAVEDVEFRDADFIQPLHEKISLCYEATGDYANALVSQRRLTKIQNETYEDKIANLQSEAIIKYETGKKDQALAAQAIEIKQQSQIQTLGLGILGTLLALLISILWSYRKNKRTTQALQIKNDENEFLVKEIHHRVKNNLQILSSLLSLQSNYITDEGAADAIKEGRNRVESMGMIHQRLYAQDKNSAIDINEYVNDLCDYLSDSFLLKSQNIDIKTDINAGRMDVETAIPLGLVINELITNSIKYAFNEKEKGMILVKIWINNNDQLCLMVKDDGQGITSDVSSKKGRLILEQTWFKY